MAMHKVRNWLIVCAVYQDLNVMHCNVIKLYSDSTEFMGTCMVVLRGHWNPKKLGLG